MLKRIFGVYEQEYSFKKLRISFFVFACIIEFILLIGFFTSGADAFSIISFIIWLAIIVIEACVLAIKNTNQTIGEYSYQNAKKQPINQTFEAKIDQLKYLFNLGVITEEQYQNAVKKVTQDFIDKI